MAFAVNALPALVAYLDTSARYVWVNDAFGRFCRASRERILGRHPRDVLGPAAWANIAPHVERALAGEEVSFYNVVTILDRGPRDVRASYVPHRDGDGRVCGFVAMITDVTDVRAAERERERAICELRETDRRKNEFLAMLAHELRNPLAAIAAWADVLACLEPGDEQDGVRARSVITAQVQHMKRLLEDLLDVSRVSRGVIELERKRVDLNAMLRQAVELSRNLLEDKQHRVALELSPVPIAVDGDPTRLVQVLDNLIHNAAKYTGRGGQLSIASKVEAGEAVVSVRDDGVGMTPELLARAFDLFAQGKRSLDREQGGLGVGLTLVRMLVERHGGSVEAFSEGEGRGSELVVRLPLARTAELTPIDPAPAVHEPAQPSLRVLVVDDNVEVAEGLAYLLERHGHRVAVAHDGPGALAAAGEESPDLVLLDIGLPGMDGYAVASRLRSAGHTRAALVALTGYAQPEDLERSRDAGFYRHLVKPIDVAELDEVARDVGSKARSTAAGCE
jgi:PAS domain S-box-containing protein